MLSQLDWAIWCPDIWSGIILGVSMRVFLNEINIKINSQVKQGVKWASHIQSFENLKREKGRPSE
jgi:hypothetical protein